MSFVTPPVFTAMNNELGIEIIRATIAGLEPGLNFSRLSAPRSILDASFGTITELLQTDRIALHRKFVVDGDAIVNLAVGAGYADDDENPNANGMGNVAHKAGLALAVTYADAPSATIAHPSGVVAAVSGIWNQLPKGTVSQTIALIRARVEALGQAFHPDDLWINLSAGAREESFFIDENGRKILLSGPQPDLYDARIYPVFGQARPYGLDLSGLFYDLWVGTGVRKDRIGFDARNTMTARDAEGNLILPSKRASEAHGNPAWTSSVQAIVWTGNLPI